MFFLCGLWKSCKSFWFVMDLDFVFSKLPWLGKSNMVITLEVFWGPTMLMFRDRHNESQSCNSPFFFYTCVWGLWNEQHKCHKDDEWKKMPLLCIWITSSKLRWLESHMATTLKAFWGPTCFLRGTMILNLVIPHFSLANVLGCFLQFAK